MHDNTDTYVIVAEMKDSTFRVLTSKLNVKEARQKLEILHMNMKSDRLKEISRAFIYNLERQDK